jgi:para-aminobenzoate synthetase component 2
VASPHVLVVDNFDSFVYNLVDELDSAGAHTTVLRSNDATVNEVRDMNPDGILLSPGPRRPEDAQLCLDLLTELGATVPIFGVCLGHQCIGTAFGATVGRAPVPVHGKTNDVVHDGTGIFDGITSPMIVTRYHSLVIYPESVPDELEVIATASSPNPSTPSESGRLVMAIRHRTFPIVGVQFHPESVMTIGGSTLIRNWLASL